MSGYDTLNFGYIPADDNEIASFLRNTGGLVNIRDSSVPPTPGQTLVAIDANNASWGAVNTNVTLTMPSEFSVAGSPGDNLVVTKTSQAANLVYASPNGAPGVPTFRSLVAADLPVGNQNLAQTLAVGNVTLANDIVVSTPQKIKFVGGISISDNNSGTTTASTTGIAIGGGATSSGTDSIAIGNAASATFTNSVAIGPGAITTANNEIKIGVVSSNVNMLGSLDVGGVLALNPTSIITTNNGPDHLKLFVAATKSVQVNRSLTTNNQNSCCVAYAGPVYVIPANDDFNPIVYNFVVNDFNDNGTPNFDLPAVIKLSKLFSLYHVTFQCSIQTDIGIPNTVARNIPFRIDDFTAPSTFNELMDGYCYLVPNGNPANTRTSVCISFYIKTLGVPMNLMARAYGASALGRYAISRAMFSAVLVN